MTKFLQSTAWTMEKIKPYGTLHIMYFVIGVALSCLIGYLLRNKSIKTIKKIIFIIGVFLLITELYKQLFYTYVIGEGSYQWWIFPFQLCSVPMYFCLIMPFVKSKKTFNNLAIFLLSYNLLGGFISFLEPSGLIHEYITLTIHAFLWHMSLVFLGMILAFSKTVKKEKKDFVKAIYTFLALCVLAFIINLIFYKVSNGDINMFYVGPRISPIIIFKDIATKYGWYVNTPIYIILMTFGAYIFYYPISLLYSKTASKESLLKDENTSIKKINKKKVKTA